MVAAQSIQTGSAFSRLRFVLFSCIACLVALSGCAPGEEPLIQIVQLDSEDAAREAEEIENDVSVDLADGLEIRLWASERLLGDPVGMHVNDLGHVYVTQTRRHRQQEFDIRDRTEWMIPSITWQTVEDRRAFLREELAPERSDENTWLPDLNEDGSHDWRDLTVLKETIYRIDDTHGDGIADRSQVFYEGFTEEISDIAAGVFSYGDDVYVTVAPDFWRMQDTSGDGWADSRESIADGFSVHIGYSGHGLSGPTMGPDGRLYWSIGDFGMNTVGPDGTHWEYPNQGVVVRSNPDGSDFEVYAHGLRNTHEFAFDEYGNLLTVDNDGDQPGEHERLVYLVNGSDSGWRINWQFGKHQDPDNNNYRVWMEEGLYRPRFEGQAAYILPPIAAGEAGPSGVAFNPGTALSDEWRNTLFVSEFTGTPPRSRISAIQVEEHGAGFELSEYREVLSGLQATSMAFGPDGALYFSDWIEGWGMNGEGRIWKMDTPETVGSEIRQNTQALLAEQFDERSEQELSELLRHDDMRVRQKAQFELVDRGGAGEETLLQAVRQTDHQLARVHGLWGLGQLARQGHDVGDLLMDFLQDQDPEIRAQSAKVLGDVRYAGAGDALIPLLQDEASRPQFFAAEALGRIEYQPAIQPIIDMLEANDDEDAYLRHGGTLALARIGDPEPIVALADHSSRSLRIAAVVALRRMEHPGVVEFLNDEDEYIVTEAARAINDDFSIEDALPELGRSLEDERFADEALLRRAINANLRGGTAGEADRVAAFAARENAPQAMRVEALQTLGVWPRPSILDRVDGRYRGAVERDPAIAQRAIAPVIEPILADAGAPEVRVAAAETVGRLQFHDAAPALLARVQQDGSADVRVAALQALNVMDSEYLADGVAAGLEDADPDVRRASLALAPGLDATEVPVAQMLLGVVEQAPTEERQAAIGAMGTLQTPESRNVLDDLLDRLIAGDIEPALQLDLLNAAEADGDDALMQKVDQYHAQKPQGDTVARYQELLYGGDPQRGRDVLVEHTAASCMRCHAVGGQGGDVGPALDNVGARLTREQLLQALVEPNARIAPGYGIVRLTLQGDERVTGTLQEETDTQLVMEVGGEARTINKDQIVERRDDPSSMPAMGGILTRDEIRDLVEHMARME